MDRSTAANALVLVLLVAVLLMSQRVNAAVYCGQFDQPAIATGFFAVVLSDAQGPDSATYAFDVTVNASALSAACPVLLSASAPVLKYHLHSKWQPATAGATMGMLGGCAATVASGHYDPDLACGPASSYAATDCALLTRTAADGYQYRCNQTTFAGRPGACEVGDLSGKFGAATATRSGGASTSMRVRPASTYVTGDLLPPYTADFAAGGYASVAGWSSVVFHCDDAAGTRLFCAQLQQVASWEACAQGRLAAPPGGGSGCGDQLPPHKDGGTVVSPGIVALISIICLIAGGLAGYFGRSCQKQQPQQRQALE